MTRATAAVLPRRRIGVAVCVAVGLLGAGLWAAHRMEAAGHIVTGMNNHVVWGLPHVFAIFLIVAASGVLNVASIGSVFGKRAYKARAPLSALLCIALLAGGLMVLMLDLGRPDRLMIAATQYNPTSVFAWNVLLYSGMFAIAGLYLWTVMEPRMNRHATTAGFAAFAWRLVLTTGTGSIFAFVVARDAWGSALLAPLFIAMSLAWGMAVFLVAQAAVYACHAAALPESVRIRMSRLLGVFVATTLYLVTVHHVTNLYFARKLGVERFLLFDGGLYPLLFWAGFVVAGCALPLLLVFGGRFGRPRHTVLASVLVIAGALCWLYVLVIGGQAWPLDLFPGSDLRSSLDDGRVARYVPSSVEWLLGLSGVAAAFLVTAIGLRLFDFLPVDTAPDTAPAAAHRAPAGGDAHANAA